MSSVPPPHGALPRQHDMAIRDAQMRLPLLLLLSTLSARQQNGR